MNDNIIINIISKTYFSIISFFVLIFWLLLVLFIVLQNGLFVNEVSFANIHMKQLYIKWNNKIDISLEELLIEKPESTDTEFNFEDIKKYFMLLSKSKECFSSITLPKIVYNNSLQASFQYKENQNGILHLKSQGFLLDTSLAFEKDILHLTIDKLKDNKRKIDGKGDVYFDPKALEAYAKVDIIIADNADLSLFAKTTTTDLNYKLLSNKKIKKIKHLIDIAGLTKEVRYWAYTALDMSYVEIQALHGSIHYSDIQSAYKNVFIKAIAHNVHYTYNPKLGAIDTKHVALEFKDGILYIRPYKAFTYNQNLKKSYITIDFTGDDELLALYLLFDGVLDDNMLKILHTYKINPPFKQYSGKISINLRLDINLQTIAVKAKGDFYTKKANIDYVGVNLDIADAYIQLNNLDIDIKNVNATYKDIANANVSGTYDTKRGRGKLTFTFNSSQLLGATLKTKKKSLKATYTISPKGDSISISKSHWSYKKNDITINAMQLPFDIKSLKVAIPATIVTLEGIGNAFVSGNFDLNDMSADLDFDILKFNYDGVKLSQSNTPIKLKYDKKVSIFSNNTIHFSVAGSKYKVKKLYIGFEDNMFQLKHTSVEIGKYIQTKVYANYNNETKKAHVSVSDFILKDPNTQKIVYKNNKIMLSAKLEDDSILVSSDELDAKFISKESGWKLTLNSIGRVAKNAPLLKKYRIDDGEITFYKKNDTDYIRFKSDINYPYKIFVNNNIPFGKYKIQGKIYKEKVSLDINDDAHISIKDTVKINMKNCAINLPEVLRAIDEINSFQGDIEDTNVSLQISAKALDSYLYVTKTRKMIYNSIHLQYFNEILSAQLQYGKGEAGFHLEGKKFHFHGKNFNDYFMNKLFSLSKFSKGTLSFSMFGAVDHFSGLIVIDKTTIKDYKTFNNILAFINTIPSLVTFNVPGYSKDGIFLKQAYVNFNSKKSKFHLTDIFVDSQEIDVLGNGDVDISQGNLDLTLNLRTDLGSGLAKVPVLGKILLNKDSIATTLKIYGDVADPKVESLIAQEIIVAPINLIKRTLTFPYDLIKSAIDSSDEK